MLQTGKSLVYALVKGQNKVQRSAAVSPQPLQHQRTQFMEPGIHGRCLRRLPMGPAGLRAPRQETEPLLDARSFFGLSCTGDAPRNLVDELCQKNTR